MIALNTVHNKLPCFEAYINTAYKKSYVQNTATMFLDPSNNM